MHSDLKSIAGFLATALLAALLVMLAVSAGGEVQMAEACRSASVRLAS